VCRRSEGNAEFSSFYLRKAAYSAVVDEIRRARRRREIALEERDTEDGFTGEQPGPEQLYRGLEAAAAIRDCLGRLIRPRRLAVTLHLQGHRVPEVARLLGWSPKRAENLVYRGLVDLRECLDGKGIVR
jgi:RNA polymerase sigma-70 factor (ECF subfamily)